MKKKNFLINILSSVFFKRASTSAAGYASNSARLLGLIRDAINKSGGLSGANFAVFREQLGIVTRLLKAYASGQYRAVPWKTLLRIIAVLVYFVSPIDILPDFLPIVGLSDDIALMLWLFSGLKEDLDKFRQWEETNTGVNSQTGRPLQTIRIG